LMECNLYELMKDRKAKFNNEQVKSYMQQIYEALSHMHTKVRDQGSEKVTAKNSLTSYLFLFKGVFHRDIKVSSRHSDPYFRASSMPTIYTMKPENVLVHKSKKKLKLADFGSCRGIGAQPPFTEYISTRWYRPPGCIQFELTALYPLFPGSDEPDQINRIHRVLGNPKAHTLLKLKRHASSHANFNFPRQEGIGLSKLLPDASSSYIDLLSRSVAYDTVDRITSREAVDHLYFETGGRKAQSTIHQGKNDRIRGHRQNRNSLLSTNKAKVAPAPTVASSSSFPPINDAKQVDEASKAGGPDHSVPNVETLTATKPRSMVSILLARSSQNEFSQESKSRNKTIYRRGKMPPKEAKPRGGGGTGPKNENATSQSTRRRRRVANKKFAHVRSSGYGGTASTEPTSGSGGSAAPNPNTKLPPLPPLKEDLKQKHTKKRNGKGGRRTKRLPPIARSGYR
ncbi:hypothetical protein THAOC_02884, partial [Thalassiosira oceanica]